MERQSRIFYSFGRTIWSADSCEEPNLLFWGILKCEMYYLNHFETYEELVAAVEQFIHYYNHQRRQHKLNCLPPATYRSLLEAA